MVRAREALNGAHGQITRTDEIRSPKPDPTVAVFLDTLNSQNLTVAKNWNICRPNPSGKLSDSTRTSNHGIKQVALNQGGASNQLSTGCGGEKRMGRDMESSSGFNCSAALFAGFNQSAPKGRKEEFFEVGDCSRLGGSVGVLPRGLSSRQGR